MLTRNLLTLFAGLIAPVYAIDSIVVDGNAFWKGDDRFYIRGVDYQPGGSSDATKSDPLAHKETCERDVEKFKDLGINTIRVYSIDPANDHSDCMQLLEDNNIYLILDVNNPDNSINRASAECSYNAYYMKNVFDVIEEFSKYDNTLGFFAGNEVINDDKTTGTAQYVKAVVRDMKQYISARGYRKIPVGYSAADIETNRKDQLDYFTCGDDEDSRIDFFGHNDYSWCGKSDFQTSGYDKLMDDFKGAAVPIFFSEFGCNSVTDRPFTEIEAIYSDKMTSVLSGGLVYEYSQEANNYGLVQISDDGSSVKELGSYNNLKDEYSKTSTPSGDGGYSSDNDYPSCPSTSSTWKSGSDLPDQPDGVKQMIQNGAGQILGISKLGQTSFMCNKDFDLQTGSSGQSSNSSASDKFDDDDDDQINVASYSFANDTKKYSNVTNSTALVTISSKSFTPLPTTTLDTSLPSSTEEHSTSSTKKHKKEKTSSVSVTSHAGQARLVTVPTVFSLVYLFANLL